MTTLVLLPGLDGTGQLFTDFAAAIAPATEVIIANYPPRTPLGYAELEPIARAFLPQDRDYYLLAESFSGPIAISLARSAPPGLRGLILCCSFARNPIPLLAKCQPMIDFMPVGAVPVSLLSPFVIGRFSSPKLRAALASAIAGIAPAVLKKRARAALSVDVSDLLAHIPLPILYLRATEDRIVSKASSALLVAGAPQTRVVDFVAPHFLLQVLPHAAAHEVLSFMSLRSHGCYTSITTLPNPSPLPK